MTGRTLVLAKMDLREMEQFVLVNYNLKNICACGLFYLHLNNFFNLKAYATLVTEHNFSGYVLFNLFLLYFL